MVAEPLTTTLNSRVSFHVILFRLTSFGEIVNSSAPVARNVNLHCGSTGSVEWMSKVALLTPVMLCMLRRVSTTPSSPGPIVMLRTFSSLSGWPARLVTRTTRLVGLAMTR